MKTHRGIGCFLVMCAIFFGLSTGCTFKKAKLGTSENPIKLFFVPSVDAKVISDTSQHIRAYLEKETQFNFKVSVPTSYVAVVEAFGTGRADVASLNTFGYILAHQKFGAQARLTVLRHGHSTYRSQILAPVDSSIKSLSDIDGKKVAFVDPASISGYLLPLKLFKDNGVSPSQTVFAGKHDNVVSMIYQGQVDAGATFYSPPQNGEIQDARRLVKTQYPDVEEKIKILQLTDDIPNSPVVFRKDMPEEIKSQIVEAFLKYIKTEEGKENFFQLYGVTDLKKATDSDYDAVRAMLKTLGKSASKLVKN